MADALGGPAPLQESEATSGEEKRRSKVLPRFFDERSCLKLAFATLIRALREMAPDAYRV
ncbi:hypothetical protein LR013_01345 [candidate division NPL-UPA2 bacterium]|nr:hypothetical protein [candidate division NPL-UPA2 bacterium]